MKRVLLTLAVVLGCVAVSHAATSVYGITVSTFAITDAGKAQDIAGTVRLRQITVTNPTSTAQTLSFYSTAASTTTAKKMFDFAIPATVGPFYPFGQSFIATQTQGDIDSVVVADLAVRTSTTTASNAAAVIILAK